MFSVSQNSTVDRGLPVILQYIFLSDFNPISCLVSGVWEDSPCAVPSLAKVSLQFFFLYIVCCQQHARNFYLLFPFGDEAEK